MKRESALKIAEKYKEIISPHCVRCEIAGSIRRERQDVKDIELCVIPKEITSSNFFGDVDTPELRRTERDPEFVKLVNSFSRVKGNGEGKYTQIVLPKQNEFADELQINLDLFITTVEQWGLIFMIRTGSADFSRRMVTEIKSRGFFVKEGWLWNQSTNSKISCYEEKEFFSITGLPWVEPFARVM